MLKKSILILIILLAFTLRFYKLGENPPSLYWDEVALGYNAYSISQTGFDEEGPRAFTENPSQFYGIGSARIPVYLYLRSFGDFKPPLYSYTAVPVISIFGLSELSTRFPSAFFGSLTVVFTFLLTHLIMKRIQQFSLTNFSQNTIFWVSTISTLLLAISPWHTQLSRVAYEANLALFLVVLAIWLFYKSLQSKHKVIFLTISGIAFVLTLYTFNSNRVFTPLLVITLALIYWKDIVGSQWQFAKSTLVALIVSLFIFIPLYPHLVSPQGQLRFKEVNIFSDPYPVQTANQRIERLGNTWWAGIFNNRRLLYLQLWLDGYFQHFSGRFLFISGDINPRFSVQDVGGLYLIELPFLMAGLYMFALHRKKEHLAILAWLFLAPVPAAFAREVPHALRAENMLPTFQIITAYGFVGLITRISKQKNSFDKFMFKYLKPLFHFKSSPTAILVIKVSAILLVLNVIYYLHIYYVHNPKFTENEWQYGYKEMVYQVQKLQDQYDRIVISDALGRPYINLLFYSKYPPQLFQQQRQAQTDSTGFGFIDVIGYGKYQFKGVNWKKEIAAQGTDEKVLLVGVPQEIDQNKFTKAVVKNLKGETVFILNEAPKGQEALLELK